MFLINPPTYVSVAQIKADANDFPLGQYSDAQLLTKLIAASSWAESIMKQKLLAQEQKIRYIGDGSDRLSLKKTPLLYVKRAQIVVPGVQSYFIPPNELLIDYESGEVYMYAPLYFAGAGYRSLFPLNAPIDITLAWGYGYVAAAPPLWTAADYPTGGLPPGEYNVAVTTATFWGETTPWSGPNPVRPGIVLYDTATGSFTITMTSNNGAYIYRIYISPAANNTTLAGAAVAGAATLDLAANGTIAIGDQLLINDPAGPQEIVEVVGDPSPGSVPITPTLYAHAMGVAVIEAPLCVNEAPVSAFAGQTITASVATLDPQNGLPPDPVPVMDTSPPPMPAQIQEAVKLLFLSGIFERNNKANRGIYQQRITDRTVSWRSTEGQSGKGTPLLVEQATALLQPYIYRGLI